MSCFSAFRVDSKISRESASDQASYINGADFQVDGGLARSDADPKKRISGQAQELPRRRLPPCPGTRR